MNDVFRALPVDDASTCRNLVQIQHVEETQREERDPPRLDLRLRAEGVAVALLEVDEDGADVADQVEAEVAPQIVLPHVELVPRVPLHQVNHVREHSAFQNNIKRLHSELRKAEEKWQIHIVRAKNLQPKHKPVEDHNTSQSEEHSRRKESLRLMILIIVRLFHIQVDAQPLKRCLLPVLAAEKTKQTFFKAVWYPNS